jgi:hypothetical protein
VFNARLEKVYDDLVVLLLVDFWDLKTFTKVLIIRV